MKTTDIAIIVVIAILVTAGAYGVGNYVFGDPSTTSVEVIVLSEIGAVADTTTPAATTPAATAPVIPTEPGTEKIMGEIGSSVIQPDPEVFSPTAINPTVEVFVGNCDKGLVWDPVNRVCISPTVETEDNPETDPETSETGE